MLSAGMRLGNFEIVAPLRSGGMAALYLARRFGAAGFDRLVAIKVIHGHLAKDEDFITMFLDEARLASRIQDPHVVHVEELGEDDGRYFMVMEFVQGRSLAELLKALDKIGRRMNPALAIHIAVQIARGLEAAHEASGTDGKLLGVVHRDVSPQNVLVSFRGHVKLIDFGIAKARGQHHQTMGDSLRGKLAYMSPEQAFGREVDARTDVYAVGVVLWEMLTGKRLFSASNELALLELVRAPAVPPPSAIAPGLSSELDRVILAALEPDLSRRTATARELSRRLSSGIPEAIPIAPADLAALIEAVAPDDTKAPWHSPRPEARPSPVASQVALDTLSISTDTPPKSADATGSTVVALEAARDDAARWRRRTVGVGLAASTAVAMVVGFVALRGASGRATRDATPADSSLVLPPVAASTPPAVTPPIPSAIASTTEPSESTSSPRASASAARTTRGPHVRSPAHHASTTPSKSDAGSGPASTQRAVELINGVPMVRDDNL